MESSLKPSHHVPVLLDEVVSLFKEQIELEGPNFLDGTLGGAGHTEALLKEFPRSTVVALDQDRSAIKRAETKLAPYSGRVEILHSNFRESAALFSGKTFDGILLDLGISSDQLDDSERGFSFKAREALDMRMNQEEGSSALELLNSLSQRELTKVLLQGGVRKLAPKLAERVVERRPIVNAEQFISLCLEVLDTPRERRLRGEKSDKNPATVVYQALRIAVNDELGAIETFLDTVEQIIAPGAVLAIVTFHSLEDELVTRRFRRWGRVGNPTRYKPEGERVGVHLTQKPIEPSEREVSLNPRSRSARLRAFKFSHSRITQTETYQEGR